MLRKSFFILACVVIATGSLFAQDAPAVSFKGFVKFDAFFDSRQTVTAREGHFLLYPAGESMDADGNDVNASPNLNMLAIQTRLTTSITGPDAFGAKTSGTVEGAFFGHSNADINGFRLRHAFVNLAWENTTLTFGQTWHPMFVTACFPGVVSFNTGVPFQPFSRNPQIRLTQKMGNASLILAAMSQRDFASQGGSDVLRNAVVPNMHAQVQFASDGNVFGAGVDYKAIRPELVTAAGYETSEKASGMSFIGYGKLGLGESTVKVYGVYGQNLYDMLAIGGYATTEKDATTGVATYTPLNVMSVWGEFSTGKEWEKGIFFGYSKTMGAGKDIIAENARGGNIDNIMRVSPRLQWNSGKTRISTELEYTSAAYGTIEADGKVTDAKAVSNIRFLFAVFYFFNS
jgi:hypothetical protein